MELVSLKYIRDFGKINQWEIVGSPSGIPELSFCGINLIVGQNASGKSNTVKAIRNLSDLLSGEKKPLELDYKTASYDVVFKDGDDTIIYQLKYENGIVTDEKLVINDETYLDRNQNKLYYVGLQQFLSFKTDNTILAVTRRDSEQQAFFDALYTWATSLSHYSFGSSLGRNVLVKDIASIYDAPINFKDTEKVSGLFVKAITELPELKELVIGDMEKVGYILEDIISAPIKHLAVDAYGISVKEKGLDDITDQIEMSQGMFRALSLIIQMNYSLQSHTPSCILIDDIGEGLDYERSQSLIKLIIEKAKASNLQVIMTTNDRFVMNNIPLEFWNIIKRENNKSIFYNIRNSKQIFEDYMFTGLNNFDFFATDFYFNGLETFDE